MNIPYSVYQGTPRKNIPYTQSKEGDPTKITYNEKPQEIYITDTKAKNPIGPFKLYKFSNNPQTYPLKDDPIELTTQKQYITKHPIIFRHIWKLSNMFPDYYVRYDSEDSFISDKNIDLFIDSTKQDFNDKFVLGMDFQDKITKYIIDNLLYKTWGELELQDKVSNEIDKISKYLPTSSRILNNGLVLLPKTIADKYLIATETNSDPGYGKWVTPKK
jgi:hypothetical protein